ncbi:muscleblind-like protein 1 [Trichonephila inaurata madagascariensis]|uniref:Muscleblind-like protein 1 n=1 Tax=Trichonephila inaurata madagascariensis TaxID=2747483 RepID=A0A8X6IH14_9ARAC|nr:muscleblind-like protein 1 [Trichonephila inaurata madagascariensis]
MGERKPAEITGAGNGPNVSLAEEIKIVCWGFLLDDTRTRTSDQTKRKAIRGGRKKNGSSHKSDLCPSVRHDMAMVSSLAAIKDSRWLQLEVCREFQRNKCSRSDTECKFAHPPSHVEVQNGRVIACYDSIKGRCNREKPPCKYFHPPQHLKDQLLINGRNHLALKNALLQQIPLQPLLTGQLPTAVVSGLLYSQLAQQQQQQQQLQQQQQCAAAFNLMSANALKATTSPYLPAMAAASTFSPYLGHTPMMTGLLPADALASPLSLVPSPLMTAAQKLQRTDRLEVCREFQRGNCKRSETECRFAHPPEHVTVDSGEGTVTVCMDFVKGRCTRDQCRYFHPPAHLQAQLKAAQTRAGAAAVTFPGIVPYAKRAAVDKSGLPVYQPTGAAYQQALAMQVQQPFVPVTCVPRLIFTSTKSPKAPKWKIGDCLKCYHNISPTPNYIEIVYLAWIGVVTNYSPYLNSADSFLLFVLKSSLRGLFRKCFSCQMDCL